MTTIIYDSFGVPTLSIDRNVGTITALKDCCVHLPDLKVIEQVTNDEGTIYFTEFAAEPLFKKD